MFNVSNTSNAFIEGLANAFVLAGSLNGQEVSFVRDLTKKNKPIENSPTDDAKNIKGDFQKAYQRLRKI